MSKKTKIYISLILLIIVILFNSCTGVTGAETGFSQWLNQSITEMTIFEFIITVGAISFITR